MGAQGGRDWASSGRLVRPLPLTEWGAWEGEGNRATQPGSWAFQTGRGGRG